MHVYLRLTERLECFAFKLCFLPQPQALFHKVLRNSKLPKGKELKGKKTKKQRVCVKWNDQHRDKGE